MKKQVLWALAFILFTTYNLQAQNWDEISKALASDAAAQDAYGFSVDIDGDYAIVGARSNDDSGVDSGSAYILVRSGDEWTEQAKLTASDAAAGDQFGYSVAISGDYAIVGAPFDDDGASQTGSTYIFIRSGSTWSQQTKLNASDRGTDDRFGTSVAIDNDYVIISAPNDDVVGSNSGSAYIFNRSGVTWSEQTKLLASDTAHVDFFGQSVAISGDYAIVGAPGNDDNGTDSGSAYIFNRSGNTWTEQSKLLASDAAASDQFGLSVSISGDYIAIGSPFDDDDGSSSGSAYVFLRSGSAWSQQEKLTAADGAASDLFGISIAIGGDYINIGARGADASGTNSGAAYMYMRSGSNWSQQEKFVPADGATGDLFGWSVGIDGVNTNAIVGAPVNSDAGSGSGSAYVFELETPEPPADVNWNEIINATASDGAANDDYGHSVSINGDYAIVGVPSDDDTTSNSGSAYIFIKSGGTWTEQAKLTASDPIINDYFGYSVSISGDYAVIGAYFKDSGVGAAYVFKRSGTNWTEQAKLTASDAVSGDYEFFGHGVSIDGDYIVVGAYYKNNGRGAAYVFTRSGTNWTEQAKLTASDAVDYDYFAATVAIDGDYAIIGASAVDDDGSASGAAYVFKRSGTNWTEQVKLTASDAAESDQFGTSVAIDGNYAIVGAFGNEDDGYRSGSAYIFTRSGTNWTEQAKLTASDADADDIFGIVVDIKGNYAIVGAPVDEEAGNRSGSAYIFKRSGSNWTEQTKLIASDADTFDIFGSDVAIDGNNAIVGAPGNNNDGVVYFFASNSFAETYTYNSAWAPSDPNGVATLDDDIIIEMGNATFNASTTANTVTVNPGAGLLLDTGVTLSVTNGISLESNATSYSSVVGDGAISGDIQYHRYVNSNLLGNDLISPPLSGQTWTSFLDPVNATALLSNPGAPTAYAFAPFDKTTGDYENYDFNTIANLTSGIGYRAATNTGETLTFTGTIPATVTLNIIDATTAYSEWNLVGNPYPSYLNVQTFLNHQVESGVSNLNLFVDESAAIYGYDGNAENGWTIYNLANTTASTVMAPGQGFFVAADIASVNAYDLEFTPAMQTTGDSDDFIAGRNAELVYLKLGLSSNTKSYNTDVYFNTNASQGLDKGYDAALWGTEAPEFSIYSHLLQDNVGKPIALQTLNATDLTEISIPLGVNANQGEQITFSISETTLPESVNVYLDDVVANTTTILNSGDYIITPATNLSGTGRFFLRTSEDALSTVDSSFDALNIFALHTSKELVVTGQLQSTTTLEVYDIQGRNVLSKTLDNSVLENRIDVSNLSGGVYVVSVKNNTQQKTQKVVFK
ncbi:T9SS type A sorting domain-containing protein [Psychroserpens ponticola]|uniref:T9SS type A sorting domain-containing protein n=1 Tax=Psychroserpens ponticola TaxID=2932268 RepID=A0ABY7RUZ2_9FLAO|nr:T9SS type A sorting domain-containing protein [Psychroserpens ponticola]WCO00739.1 T9SS type A sorting domain-containing protein [Psychroserpens ponticola]